MSTRARWVVGVATVAVIAGTGGALYWASSHGAGVQPPLPSPAASNAPAAPPDVVLITVDTLRADHVGVYGYAPARTPTMDGLAQRGMRFTNATTPLPRTTPAMASLMTGLWPHHHGSREVMDPMLDGRVLAEILGASGYTTAAVVNTPAVGPEMHLDRGFGSFVSKEQLGDEYHASGVTTRGIELARAAAPDAPFFLWVHYYDPHLPYRPPREWIPEGVDAALNLFRMYAAGEITLPQIHTDHGGEASRALDAMTRLYDAEIAYTDDAIGKLLEGISEARPERQAITVLTADHGEHLGEAGLYYEHGTHVHDAVLRVPLIIAGPGIPAGRVDEGVARLEDLAPSLLAAIGIERDEWPRFDGVDMSGRFATGGAGEPTIAFAESASSLFARMFVTLQSGRPGHTHCLNAERFSLCTAEDGTRTLHDRTTDPELERDVSRAHADELARLEAATERWPAFTARMRTARTPDYKLVEYPVLDGGFRAELYDLHQQGERRDVSGTEPEALADLTRRLHEWFEPVPMYRTVPVSNEQLEALRSLGYVQ